MSHCVGVGLTPSLGLVPVLLKVRGRQQAEVFDQFLRILRHFGNWFGLDWNGQFSVRQSLFVWQYPGSGFGGRLIKHRTVSIRSDQFYLLTRSDQKRVDGRPKNKNNIISKLVNFVGRPTKANTLNVQLSCASLGNYPQLNCTLSV